LEGVYHLRFLDLALTILASLTSVAVASSNWVRAAKKSVLTRRNSSIDFTSLWGRSFPPPNKAL